PNRWLDVCGIDRDGSDGRPRWRGKADETGEDGDDTADGAESGRGAQRIDVGRRTGGIPYRFPEDHRQAPAKCYWIKQTNERHGAWAIGRPSERMGRKKDEDSDNGADDMGIGSRAELRPKFQARYGY
ncbi:uncharacterized protein CCOS01_01867, partial [Colletotrichum costaricense]